MLFNVCHIEEYIACRSSVVLTRWEALGYYINTKREVEPSANTAPFCDFNL